MNSITPSDRAQMIKPFRVMEILREAKEFEEKGFDVVHFEVGEPDFTTALPITEAGKLALLQGHTSYTQALGLPELRTRISDFYKRRFGVQIEPNRIGITSGASAALNIIFTSLINAGDGILMTDPGYPCNEAFVQLAGGLAQKIQVDRTSGFQMSYSMVERYWNDQTVGLLLSSPSNPTGTIIEQNEFELINDYVNKREGFLVVDEIYQGLIFDDAPSSQMRETALQIDPSIIVVNSFSKYFGMTGWRLGWFVVPETLIGILERIAQNTYISPSSIAQYAALEAFDPLVLKICEERRLVFQKRRDLMASLLEETGLSVPQLPQGAFYIYADVSLTGMPSEEFCKLLLAKKHVAVTPGSDFGAYRQVDYVRFAFTTSESQIIEGMKRVKSFVQELIRNAI